MRSFTKFILALLVSGSVQSARAQLSGVYNVPATYSTIAAAINDLNINGVNGSVTIAIAAGYTETAVTGGYTLNNIIGASSINQISFKKSGIGVNPVIYAYTGTATPVSAIQDGIWRFNGSDYITIEQLDFL